MGWSRHRVVMWAMELPVEPLPKLVLIVLAEHSDENGECWPSLRRLAELTGLSRSSLLKWMSHLTSLGAISKTRAKTDKRRTVYRLALGRSVAADGSATRTQKGPPDGPNIGAPHGPTTVEGSARRTEKVRGTDPLGPSGGPTPPGHLSMNLREPQGTRLVSLPDEIRRKWIEYHGPRRALRAFQESTVKGFCETYGTQWVVEEMKAAALAGSSNVSTLADRLQARAEGAAWRGSPAFVDPKNQKEEARDAPRMTLDEYQRSPLGMANAPAEAEPDNGPGASDDK